MKLYVNHSILIIVLLLSQLALAMNAAGFAFDGKTGEASAETSMPCHQAAENLPTNDGCCDDNCACPLMACAGWLLTLDSGLLKASFPVNAPKYAACHTGKASRSVNPPLRPPISA